MHNQDFRLAHIGCGYWGKNIARTFNKLGVLRYLCDISEEAANSLRSELDLSLKTITLSEFNSLETVDAVSIATPAETHFQIASDCIKKNLHTYIEKPMCMSSSECRELIELAEENKVTIQVGHLLLYHPAIKRIKELVNEGKIGTLRYIYSNRLSFGIIRSFENVAWSFMPHDIALVMYLSGSELESSQSQSRNIFSIDKEDSAHVWLNFKSGLKSHIFASWCNPFKEHKLVLIGDKGSLIFEDSKPSDKLFFNGSVVTEDNHQGLFAIKVEENEILHIENSFPLDIACKDFISCSLGGQKPIASGEGGMQVIKVLENTNLIV